MRAARLAFIFLTSAWIVLLVAAPLAGLGGLVSGLTYAFGSLICHQRPERSFYIDAAQLPVCARCFGLYAGAALGVLAGLKPRATLPRGSTLPGGSILSWWRSPSPLSDSRRAGLRTIVLTAAAPTVITWSSEMLGVWSPTNLTRFIAALPLGAALAVTVNYIECARRQQTTPRPPRIHI